MDGFTTIGITGNLKEDTHSTTAEMVYGTTRHLPGEIFTSSSNQPPIDPADYVSQLKAHMQQIRPSQPRLTHRDSHVCDALSDCTHIFIRVDGVRKPLQPPYNGPYPVLTRTNKHFTIDINGRKETVSHDRLNDNPFFCCFALANCGAEQWAMGCPWLILQLHFWSRYCARTTKQRALALNKTGGTSIKIIS